MSYTVTKYPHGAFSWSDVASTDFPKTKEFLTKLFGWTSVDMPTGEGRPDYTMFYLDGKQVAGGSPTFIPDMPSFWSNYINVDNVDKVVAQVENLGGKVVMPPMDVLDSGRMATITDPTGANVGLWQPKDHIGAHIVNTVGAMCWNELYTPDVAKAQEFYGKLLGWTFETEDDYTTIKNKDRMNGGMMWLDPAWGEMPPNWTVYFNVANIEESINKVKELGGQVWMQKDISVGKIAMVADPTGAGMMLMQMSVEPEHWHD